MLAFLFGDPVERLGGGLRGAVSRAKCLGVVIANPALMAIKCQTPEQMALVNTLCWVAEAGRLR